MAFGTGSAVAHRAVDAVMGPRTIQHETVASEAAGAPAPTANSLGGSDACNIHSRAFTDVWIILIICLLMLSAGIFIDRLKLFLNISLTWVDLKCVGPSPIEIDVIYPINTKYHLLLNKT